ncbi:Ricin B lectin [Nosema bombycis CQ1]|uniref:Ricin B lectin n=1 Tax=Nosema bombycis (strain CQ1 / CVCC 102059) TaxID=578461 RepID=R0KYL2_NOSB1|nr:Ricin B lectin [Nosema bombycis CQ1]WGJ64375.1 ricin B lectin-like protein [Nosema bombycis]|eukprot:EOB15297.1 Ricin B lectin [Nosema bombycis CQ1]
MKFTFLFIFGITQSLLIKHKSDNNYLSLYAEGAFTYVKLTPDEKEAVDVTFTPNKDGSVFIKNSQEPNKSFDIADNKDKLIMYNFHGGNNQQFMVSMVDNRKYKIINNGQCLDYDAESKKILKKTCTNSESQVFDIFDKNSEDSSAATDLNSEKIRYNMNEIEPVYELYTDRQLPRKKHHRHHHHHHHYDYDYE